jgi:rhamnosyltransferase
MMCDVVKQKSTAGTIILYNPNLHDVINNIKSYVNDIDLLLAIDNSENIDPGIKGKLTEAFSNLIYLANSQNYGIASALNQAAQIAIDMKYSWLLTMDQDSFFEKGMAKKYISTAETIQSNKVAMFTCNILLKNGKRSSSLTNIEKVDLAQTSGSLLNLSIFREIGSFKEDYFIDKVDYEYCFRLIEKGYTVLGINFIHLVHQLGNMTQRKLFTRTISVTSHEPVRWYYNTRNNLHLITHHGSLRYRVTTLFYLLFYDPIVIILYEEKKKEKIKHYIKGICHFMTGKYGKYDT